MKRQPGEDAHATLTLVRKDQEPEGVLEAPDPVRRTFQDGALVAGRYRVVRFIAEGSQGEVYEVEDISLHERVALKTIQPELASRPGSLKRFKDELRLARRVTHPNVCRVFDLGEHREASGGGSESQPVTFLTMELLEGETLSAYVRRSGRIPPGEALSLAEQMASALDAAHSARIIHRDFKSSNVVLLSPPSPAASPRVVVTDFGLALGTAREENSSDSWRGGFIGTPSYMSPEQVAGLAVSPSTDIYSFGVVLYEMVTGRLPFVAATLMGTALQRLERSPEAPRTWVPELDAQWDAVLLRCMAREPQDRFASAGDAVAALRSPGHSSSSPAPSPRQSGAQPQRTSSAARQVLAVLTPRSLRAHPETAWVSTAVAEVLSVELAAGGQVRLLSGEEVARMRKELSLPEAEGFARDTLDRIRIHSGAALLLTGTYLALGPAGSTTLRLDLRLLDTGTGEAVAQLTETGHEQDLLALLSRTGAMLRQLLGLAPLNSEQTRRVRSAMPANPESARLYAEGLAALRSRDAAMAVERLESVVKREPGFALAHSALAAACQGLFLAERAKEAARRAFELSEGLLQEERLLVQARHHEAQADWGRAIEAWQTLVALCPDSVEYGTALVSAQVSAGQPREAFTTIEVLRRLPSPLGEDARIDMVASVAAWGTGDFAASSRHAQIAAEKARGARQWLLAASAMTSEAYASRNLGKPTRAVELMEEAERLFLAGGDRGGALRAMLTHAIALIDLMRLRDAEGVMKTALQMSQGYRGSILEGEVLGIAGWLWCHLGNATEALRLSLEALVIFQGLDMPTELANQSVQRAMVRRHQGALEEGQRLLEEALRAAQAVGDDYTAAWAHEELGELFIERGELSQARSRLEQSLELRRTRGLRAFMVDTELGLVKLALAEGDTEQALALAEQARASCSELQNRDKEGLTHALTARALLARGETVQAQHALSRAQALAGQSEDVFIMAEVLLTRAQVAALLGDLAESAEVTKQLHALIARVGAGGLKGLELQARLALAELSRTSGDPSF